MAELLERDRLIDEIDTHVDRARSGVGSTLFVAGEAGSGKTSLVRAAASRVEGSAVVVVGSCDPLSTPRPLGPLMDFAGSADSGLAEIAAGMEPQEMFGLVMGTLRRRLRPMVLVVEDAHWADQGTLDFLLFIGRRIADSNGVLICTYRDDEVGAAHPLRFVLGQLASLDSTHRLDVPLLSRAAVVSMTGQRDVDPDRLFELTGGNAFFVTEVLATGDAIPTNVQDAVLARVAMLSPRARAAAEAVSIAPRSLDAEHLSPLAAVSGSDLDEAVEAGVLLTDGRAFWFRHELARAAVAAAIAPQRRADLHIRMVAILVEDGSPDLARIAHHAVEADAAGLVARYAPEAARAAVRGNAHHEAVAFYEAAITHGAELAPRELAILRLELAAELVVVDRPADSLEQATLAETELSASGEPEDVARALRAQAGALWGLTDTAAAGERVQAAIDLLRDGGPSQALSDALAHAAYLQMLARHFEPGMRYAGEARAMAEGLEAADSVRRVDHIIGCLEMVAGQPEDGARLLEQVVADSRSAGDDNFALSVLSNLGSAAGEARLYDTAIPTLDEVVRLSRQSDADYLASYALSWLARVSFEQGRWGEVEGHVKAVEAISRNTVGIAIVTARGALGRTKVRRGEEGGRQLLEDTARLGMRHEVQHVWSLWCGIAEHAWLWGKPESIPGLLADMYDRSLDTDSPWARGSLAYWMWIGGGVSAAPSGCAEPFRLQIEGDWRAAAGAWRELGCPYETAISLADGDADAQLEALELLDLLGARPAGSLVRARLRAAGVEAIPRGPIGETRANPANLTPRQLEVARLLTEGMSNAEIAERLYVSKKTVEHHVSAVFAKLGVESREEARREGRSLLGMS